MLQLYSKYVIPEVITFNVKRIVFIDPIDNKPGHFWSLEHDVSKKYISWEF